MKRYNYERDEIGNCYCAMEEDEEGEYVKYADVASLEKLARDMSKVINRFHCPDSGRIYDRKELHKMASDVLSRYREMMEGK